MKQTRPQPTRSTPRSRRRDLSASSDRLSEAAAWNLTLSQYIVATTWLENGFQGAEAYRKAHPKCSWHTSRVEASRTLALPSVRQYLEHRLNEWLGPLEMRAEEAIRRVSAMARADVRLLYDRRGKLLPPHRWPAWMVPAVRKVDQGGVTLVDPLAAVQKVLELEGRLKNPEAAATDMLAEALRITMAEAKAWREKRGKK
jgi:hypothetical protein